MYGEVDTEKHIFPYSKFLINLDSVHVHKILVSIKFSSCKKRFKYFISYKDCDKVKLLYMMIPKMSGYATHFHVFFIKDLKLLEKYNKIWDKIHNSNSKWFDSGPGRVQ